MGQRELSVLWSGFSSKKVYFTMLYKLLKEIKKGGKETHVTCLFLLFYLLVHAIFTISMNRFSELRVKFEF